MDKMLLQVKKKQKTKQNNKVKRVLESPPPTPKKKEKDNKIKSRKLVAPKFKNYMHLKTHPS